MWTKFGEMTGKVISKIKPRKGLRARPKSLKTIENIANKSKPIVNKIKGGFKKVGKKALNLTDKYPITTLSAGLVAGAYGYGKTEHARVTQNQILEMQKISLERKTRSITKDEIKRRLEKAKQSKRKFTWI